MREDVKRWLNNPWFVAFATGLVLLVFPRIGDALLTWAGSIWSGAWDGAYRKAPTALADNAYRGASSSVITLLTLFLLVSVFRMQQRPTFQQATRFVLWIILGGLVFEMGAFTLERRSVDAAATFERRMMVLTPVFSDGERKALIGKWGLVNAKVDYDAIMAEMEGLAKKYGVVLPPRRDQ